eukprot:NODE_957_length_2903_cov_0.370542.p1 type:complete len:279 gc:universal NODE_957_length_2903_cov_0.370542:1654-818(-)
MIIEFDTSKLSKDGFRVLVEDKNVKLPNGSIVESGLQFRNEFHLLEEFKSEFFVPCGGRPESVDLSNVSRLIDQDGKPKFKYIVEGANLFFTQDARLRLEKSGCIIFKDASANKGGVTSSSMEVLAALSFDDVEYEKHMMVKNGQVPPFYEQYITQVHHKIEKNAASEFECLWRESELTNLPKSILSDKLSYAIVQLKEELVTSSLWENPSLRRKVLCEALPQLLLETVGYEKLIGRVPDPYVRAIFGTYLASRFVYKYGTSPPQFAFFEFIAPYLKE